MLSPQVEHFLVEGMLRGGRPGDEAVVGRSEGAGAVLLEAAQEMVYAA
jgi:hypothetical protein